MGMRGEIDQVRLQYFHSFFVADIARVFDIVELLRAIRYPLTASTLRSSCRRAGGG